MATSGVVEARRRGSDAAAAELATPRITSSDANSAAGSCLAGRYNGAADWLIDDGCDDDAASMLSELKSTWLQRAERPLTDGAA